MQNLQQRGIKDLRVDRTTLVVIAAWDGFNPLPKEYAHSLQAYQQLVTQVSAEQAQQVKEQFQNDAQDRGTPTAMTQLLKMMYTHEILTAEYTELLFKIMRRCKTGSKRLMGLLPTGTTVPHKTGTLTGYTTDAGIMYLPESAGVVIASVFVEHPTKPTAVGERVIAEVARTLYDYFLFATDDEAIS